MPSESSRVRLITWAWYLGTILFCALLLSDSLNWNFGYDQGTFAYGGSAILKGARPYLDFWDIKPPNVFYVYSLAFTLFGESVRVIRIFDFWNALLTISLLWLVSMRLWKSEGVWWRRSAAMFASFAYVLCYLIQGYQDTAQAEIYCLPLLLLSVLLVLYHNSEGAIDTWRLLLSGVAIGVTCFFKYPFGLFVLMPLAVIWVNHTKSISSFRQLLFLAGGLLIALAVQAALLLPSGELQELWKITRQATFGYRNNFSGSFGPLTNIRTSLKMFNWLWLVLGIVGCVLLLFRSDPERRRRMISSIGIPLLGVLIAFVIVQSQNKGYKYHYQVMLPWAMVLIGGGMAEVTRTVAERAGNWRYIVLTGLGIAFSVATILVGNETLPIAIFRPIFRSIGDYSSPPNGYIAGNELAEYVFHNSAPSDHIFIFGFQPYVYWITGRKPSNRFLNTIHFKPTYVAPELKEELLRSFNKPADSLPKLFFVETGDHYTSQGNSNDDSWTMLNKRYPEIVRTLNTCYWPADTVSGNILAFRVKTIYERGGAH